MSRLPFDHYYDYYAAKLDDIPIHNDFKKVLEWLSDKPGHVTHYGELACVLGDTTNPGAEDLQRAVGAMVILTTWPQSLGTVFFEVVSADGSLYPVDKVPQEALDGKAPYVLEATGETIEDLPSSLRPLIRIADFEPRPALDEIPSAGLRL
jgi:hypothetical protein